MHFDAHQQFPNIGIIELYAELEDVNDDGGPSNIHTICNVPPQMSWPGCQPSIDAQVMMNNFVESFHYSPVPPAISTTEDDAPHTSMMIESPIRGVEMESGGPSSFNVDLDPDQSFRPHCEYVGDFSEPKEYAEFDDSDDNNDFDPDVTANISVYHLSFTTRV